ncbi:ribosomal protein S16 [Wolfiporia cocos MD-104 SS10]|uniref:Ribosomal protein S16 n=1 Tax=Wolfiporia cocos (strain MD-104) TaxID=742152 RepID=A0A2H3IWQ7_WOLCO|nr:ribosomal protein S16 [Wolfiporia cocos MD-104 SS10]
MAVRLRLALHGPRHNRILHLVAIDQHVRRNGKPIETLGIMDPRTKPGENTKTMQWSERRINYWLSVGAQPSRAVARLLQLAKIPYTLEEDRYQVGNYPPDAESK